MKCQVESCSKDAKSRGWCDKHYARWRRHGDTSIVYRKATRRIQGVSDWERLLSKIDHVGDCWEWQGRLTNGYGRIFLSDGNSYLAHRAVWAAVRGPVPEGLTLDHLCFNQRCVNPDHLEPVTHAENMRRKGLHWQAVTTTCKAGLHPYPENRILEPSTGRTRCRLCRRMAQRKYKAKVREAKA